MTLEEILLPKWEILVASKADWIGQLPYIILTEQHDPRPVVDQVNDRYPFGGWQKFEGFTKWNRTARTLHYPGDPPMHAVALLEVSETEKVFVFPSAWVLIDRGLDDWEVARLD